MNETELKVLFATIDVANLIAESKGVDTDPDPSPNRGAAKLRRYWTVPGEEGYAKIGWGKHGDFMRCVRELGKYVTDPKGLCNVYHRAALGVAPGQEKIDEADIELKSKFTEGLHPRNADGTFAYKNDDGKGDAQKGDKDATAPENPDDKVHGRISEAQAALVKAGVLDKKDGRKGHAVDGYLGPKTEAALKKYQKKHGLKETGKIDKATSKKLGLKKDGPMKHGTAPAPSQSHSKKSLTDTIDSDSTNIDKKDGAMEVSYKTAPVGGISVVDEGDGRVTAIVSVTGIKDNVNDIIEPGAYTATLEKRLPKGVWSHDWNKPIAKTLGIKELMPLDPELPATLPNGEPWPDEAGALKVDMQFNLKTERGRTAYEDVVFFDNEQEWSIGYNVPAGQATRKDGIRRIKSLDLFEYSPVLFGAMPNARTSSLHAVKDAQMAYKSLMAEREAEFEDAEEYNDWFTEMKSFADSLGIEVKAGKAKADDEEEDIETDDPEETDEVEDDTDPEDNEEDVEEEDDAEEEGDEKKKKYVTKSGLSSVTAEKIVAVVDALNDLLSEAAPRAESQEEKTALVPDEPVSFEVKGSVADVVEQIGDALPAEDYNTLMDAAEEFDTAFDEGDEKTLETASDDLLNMIEENIDSVEEKVAAGLQEIAGVIAEQLDKIGGEPAEEQKDIRFVRSENGAERYGVPVGIRVDAKVFQQDTEVKAPDTSGVHGVDWIWEGESWDDYRHLWDPKHPKYKKPAAKKPAERKPRGTFQRGPSSASSSNPKVKKGGGMLIFKPGDHRDPDKGRQMREALKRGATVHTSSGRTVTVMQDRAVPSNSNSVKVWDPVAQKISTLNLGSIVKIVAGKQPPTSARADRKEDAPEVEEKSIISAEELAEFKKFSLDVSSLLDS